MYCIPEFIFNHPGAVLRDERQPSFAISSVILVECSQKQVASAAVHVIPHQDRTATVPHLLSNLGMNHRFLMIESRSPGGQEHTQWFCSLDRRDTLGDHRAGHRCTSSALSRLEAGWCSTIATTGSPRGPSGNPRMGSAPSVQPGGSTRSGYLPPCRRDSPPRVCRKAFHREPELSGGLSSCRRRWGLGCPWTRWEPGRGRRGRPWYPWWRRSSRPLELFGSATAPANLYQTQAAQLLVCLASAADRQDRNILSAVPRQHQHDPKKTSVKVIFLFAFDATIKPDSTLVSSWCRQPPSSQWTLWSAARQRGSRRSWPSWRSTTGRFACSRNWFHRERRDPSHLSKVITRDICIIGSRCPTTYRQCREGWGAIQWRNSKPANLLEHRLDSESSGTTSQEG